MAASGCKQAYKRVPIGTSSIDWLLVAGLLAQKAENHNSLSSTMPDEDIPA